MWLTAWWAHLYEPQDLPALRSALAAYRDGLTGDAPTDRFLRAAAELGLTPKARIGLRWAQAAAPPEEDDDGGAVDDLEARRQARNARLA